MERTHKHAKVQAWLARHPRIHLHFTPTYGSWLNLVEVFFSIIERQALRRGDFASVQELVAAIGRFVDAWNERCQPFRWVKDADQILGGLAGRCAHRRSGLSSGPWVIAKPVRHILGGEDVNRTEFVDRPTNEQGSWWVERHADRWGVAARRRPRPARLPGAV
jgi:hypothetical protein